MKTNAFRFFSLFCAITLFSSLYAEYPRYKKFQDQGIKGSGGYLNFVSKIKNRQVKSIFEIGSRDALDAIQLSKYFRCHVFAFECNPQAIEICKFNIGKNPNVTLVPLGVWDISGERSFYRVLDQNIGASSFFEFNKDAVCYESNGKNLIQEKIFVNCIRLDEFLKANKIKNIDLLCMDVQGASYQVLQSLGKELQKVKYIIVELENVPLYNGEVLLPEVDKFLTANGFRRESPPFTCYWDDVFYVNSTINP